MENFTDGKSDGLVLMYTKDGIIYPVALAPEDLQLLDIIIPTAVPKIYPIFAQPLGNLEPLKINEVKSHDKKEIL